jgi:2-desacetyl-2-hydroxyethyl bacteriochlorophyllide A dehydrogenase
MTRERSRRETMRAAVLTGPRRLDILEVPRPAPGPDQVLVRVEGCGLCASNVPVWQGRPWFDYPMTPGAPGHEGFGRVVEVGTDVTSVRVGDRVGFLSERALAEYDLAHERQLVRVPPELEGRLVPAEALACAMNVFRRADIRPGHAVAVVGVGFLGALLTELASRAGARVLAISRRDSALDHARAIGATATLSLDAHARLTTAASRRIADGLDRMGFDRVIEAAGTQRTLDVAAGLVRVRGRLIIAGFHQDGTRQIDMQAWNWRGIDVVNAHERDPDTYVEGMRAALDAVACGRLHPDPLYTTFSLDRAREAFEALESRPSRFMKAVVTL